MNLLDGLIVLLVLAGAGWGLATGVAAQVGAYVGLGAGLVVGGRLAPRVAALAETGPQKAVLALLCVVAAASFLGSVGQHVGRRAAAGLARLHLRALDALLGALFSATALLLGVWLLAGALAAAPHAGLGSLIQRSAIIAALERTLPPAPAFAARLGRLLDPTGFPRVFAELEPPVAAPVEAPATAEVAAAEAAAAASTVRIEGRGCGGLLEGSGFVAAPGLVVTNAHVVAGIRDPRARDTSDDLHRAVTLLFDPDLDLAVLRVDGLDRPPLPFADQVRRGAAGAVLGYPGGGSLRSSPAAVLSVDSAVGRDIYGGGLATRQVVTLQAVVRSGNSGGPFVLADGRVGGVVFARSVTDDAVGYAIAPAAAAQAVTAVRQGDGARVSTGACAAA
ncbi:MAG: MarP family serine protease [Acidimicrobiales bacterium]